MPIIIQPTEKQKSSEFGKLLQEQETQEIIEEGSLVKGKIVQLTQDFAIVDIGFKSEGQVPVREFRNQKGQLTVQIGDEVELLLENMDDDQGLIHLSKERADAVKAWDTLVKIQESDGVVEGVVVSKIKGGLVVDVGVKAFLPGSQIDVRPVRRFCGSRWCGWFAACDRHELVTYSTPFRDVSCGGFHSCDDS